MPRPRSSQTKHIIRAHGVKVFKSQHADIRALKRYGYTPSLYGNKVWASSFALMDYLKRKPLEQGVKSLDVGCGWGALGCFLASRFNAKVEAVDADKSVEPFLELTALLNGVEVCFNHKRFEQLTGRYLSQFHVLVGGDICFWPEMTGPLFNLLNRALKNGVTRAYIADPGRPPFWALAERCAEKFYADVVSHRTHLPHPSEKQILVIHNDQ